MKFFYYNQERNLNPKDKNYFPHLHNDYELLFFEEGDVAYRIGNSIYNLRKNDLLIIKPAVLHCLLLKSHATYERTIFNFTESVVLKDKIPSHELYHIPENSPIVRIIADLKAAKQLFTKEEFDYYKKASLEMILLYLKYDQSEKHAPAQVIGKTLDLILQYIDEHLEAPLSTDILSKQFYVSPSWIVHNFRKELKISAKQYINQKKILHAQEIISRGFPATKAAELCAFNNYPTFYRLYKQYLGHEPSADSPKK